MTYSYIAAIGTAWPSVGCHANGAAYTDLVWDNGDPIPDQVTLDTWIAANPEPNVLLVITKYQFRKLFTLAERIAIDNAPTNIALPAAARAALVTMNKDMELSGNVQLDNPDVAAGVNLLATLGLIATTRPAQILSNTPPTA